MRRDFDEIQYRITQGRGYLNGKYKDTPQDLERKLLSMNHPDLICNFIDTYEKTEKQSRAMQKLLKHSDPHLLGTNNFAYENKKYN